VSRNTVLLFIVVFCALGAWEHFGGGPPHGRSTRAAQAQAVSAASRIVVYGQESCGYTSNMRASLSAANVPFTYVNIDAAGNQDVLYDKFHGTGLARGGLYLLPVVEVAGQASMRPDPDSVIRAYRRQD
jgi:glutaredoxin